MTVYGFPESSNYYNGYNREAIVKVSKGGTADEIGKRIADALKNSLPHWSYLSSSEYLYMAVGCTFDRCYLRLVTAVSALSSRRLRRIGLIPTYFDA